MTRSTALVLLCAATVGSAAYALAACSSDTDSDGDDGSTQDGSVGPSGDSATPKTDSGTGGGDSSGPCNDTVGNIGLCAVYLDGGDAGNDCLTKMICGNIVDGLKPRLAQKAIECLTALGHCSDESQISDCVLQAAQQACPDNWGEGLCDQVIGSCTKDAGSATNDAGFNKAACVKFVAGMSGDWKNQVLLNCLETQNGCDDPLHTCVPY